jgi:pyruvate,water dikinase
VRALAAGAEIRAMVENQPFPADLEKAIRAFATLQGGNAAASFAVRSSATAEDLPDASFAGQQETFLNVVGIEDVLHKMKEVFASLYNDRAISYRVHKGFAHDVVALSAGVQRMVRSDLGAAGVMFTIDTESGFEDVVFITSSYGLGETVVQGAEPRRVLRAQAHAQGRQEGVIRRNLGSKLIQMVFFRRGKAATGKLVKTVDATELRNRYSLTDADVEQLATTRWSSSSTTAARWTSSGARTAPTASSTSCRPARNREEPGQGPGRAALQAQGHGTVLAEGRAIGQKIGTGPVRLVHDISRWTRCSPATCW